MFCQNCGNQISDGAKFCPNCGKPIAQGQTSSVQGNTNTIASKINYENFTNPKTTPKQNEYIFIGVGVLTILLCFARTVIEIVRSVEKVGGYGYDYTISNAFGRYIGFLIGLVIVFGFIFLKNKFKIEKNYLKKSFIGVGIGYGLVILWYILHYAITPSLSGQEGYQNMVKTATHFRVFSFFGWIIIFIVYLSFWLLNKTEHKQDNGNKLFISLLCSVICSIPALLVFALF